MGIRVAGVTSSFSKYEDFAGLIRPEGIDTKPTLLRVLSDLYIQKPAHSTEEEKHFTELALRLIDEVDEAALVDTAARLDAYGAAPAAVMRRLAVRIGTFDKPAAPEVTSAEPASELSAGTEAQASAADADRAAAAHFSDMFFDGDAAQRQAFLTQLASTGADMPPVLTTADARATIARLEAAALKARPFEFVREIEQSLGVPRAYSEKIVTDKSGEPMLVVARALSMPIDVVQRILLLLNPAIGTSVRRVFDLTALYENLPTQAALRLITLWRHAGVPHANAYRPMDAAGSDRSSAVVQRQPAAAPKRDQRAS